MAAAIATHQLDLAMLYAAAFLVSAMETLFDSATMAVVPQLVPEAQLVHANSRLQVAQLSGEQFIGPALGGILFAMAASLPVLADGFSFAVSAALLAVALRPAWHRGRHRRSRRDDFALVEPSQRTAGTSLAREVREGLAWLVRDGRLRLVCALIAGFAFAQGLGLAVLVIYCTRALHLSGSGFGVFIAIAAIGDVAGAWAAPRVTTRLGTGRTLRLSGMIGAAAFLCLGVTSSVVVAVIALGVESFAFGVGLVASIALRQQLMPLELAGRISSAMRSIIFGSAAVATLVGGALVALVGPHAPFAFGGALQMIAAIVIGGALIRRLAADERQVVDLRERIDLTESPAAAEA
jgi:MFS family permease